MKSENPRLTDRMIEIFNMEITYDTPMQTIYSRLQVLLSEWDKIKPKPDHYEVWECRCDYVECKDGNHCRITHKNSVSSLNFKCSQMISCPRWIKIHEWDQPLDDSKGNE